MTLVLLGLKLMAPSRRRLPVAHKPSFLRRTQPGTSRSANWNALREPKTAASRPLPTHYAAPSRAYHTIKKFTCLFQISFVLA